MKFVCGIISHTFLSANFFLDEMLTGVVSFGGFDCD